MHKNVRARELVSHGANATISFFAGAIGWVGGILLIFGAYALFLSSDFSLMGIGFSLICFGEGLALLKKMKRAEIEVLQDTLIKQMAKNMLFPLFWIFIFFITGWDLLLALSIATGAKAIVKNTRLVATSYIFS